VSHEAVKAGQWSVVTGVDTVSQCVSAWSAAGCDDVQQAAGPGGHGSQDCAAAESPLNVRITTSLAAPDIGTLSYCESAAAAHRPSSSFLRISFSVKQTWESSRLHVDCMSAAGCRTPHVGQSAATPGCTVSCQLSRLWPPPPPCAYSAAALSSCLVVVVVVVRVTDGGGGSGAAAGL